MLNLLIIVVALLLAGYLAFSRRLAASSDWKATVTPLASIMGSGFLVSAPLLAGIVGSLAVFCMALLLVLESRHDRSATRWHGHLQCWTDRGRQLGAA